MKHTKVYFEEAHGTCSWFSLDFALEAIKTLDMQKWKLLITN